MTTYGLTPDGFVLKPLTDIKAELEAAFKTKFGANINVSPKSVNGQILGILSDLLAQEWEMAEAVHLSYSPDNAVGASLDYLAALTGTIRKAAKKSTTLVVAVGTAGTVLSTGRVLATTDTDAKFSTTQTASIATLPAWAGSSLYAREALVTKGGNIYFAITGGTTGGSGPSGTGLAQTDGSVVWRYIAAGSAAAKVEAESVAYGPIIATAGTLANIDTPVAGWSTVTNPEDAELGNKEETDEELRARRELELQSAGEATIEAIRSKLINVEGVTAVTVFENATSSTNGDGMPPNSIECLVHGGNDDDIALAIFSSKAAGIEAHGTETEVVTDSQGITHTIKFTRPTSIPVYVSATVTVDVGSFPVDGQERVRDAIVAWGEKNLITGRDVVANALVSACFSVSGVLDAQVLIGESDPPVASTTIAVNNREVAELDTGRTEVVPVPGNP